MSCETELRLIVDLDACVGHGRCYATAPELFAPFDDEGRAEVLADRVPPELAELAARAVAACPEEAIELVEAPAGGE